MTTNETADFAAFRVAVFNDCHLRMRLRPPLPREAYMAHVAAIGVERGFVFDEAEVRAALRAGEQAWLMQGVEVVA